MTIQIRPPIACLNGLSRLAFGGITVLAIPDQRFRLLYLPCAEFIGQDAWSHRAHGLHITAVLAKATCEYLCSFRPYPVKFL